TCLRETRLRCEDVGPSIRASRESVRSLRLTFPKAQASNDRRRSVCVRNRARSSCVEPVRREFARLHARGTSRNLPAHRAKPFASDKQARPGNGSAVFASFPCHKSSLRIGTNLSFT